MRQRKPKHRRLLYHLSVGVLKDVNLLRGKGLSIWLTGFLHVNNLTSDIQINCFIKKLNGFFMCKETLSGGKHLWNINQLLDSSQAITC